MVENEQWATVDLMGHAQTAGCIAMENGLLRVDVPSGDGFKTEYYGMAAIYSIKIVSEEIARAYSHVSRDVYAYDTPIVTREQHQTAVDRMEQQNTALRQQIDELSRRLTSANALPAPKNNDYSAEEEFPF
jgi:hypothetical protein